MDEMKQLVKEREEQEEKDEKKESNDGMNTLVILSHGLGKRHHEGGFGRERDEYSLP